MARAQVLAVCLGLGHAGSALADGKTGKVTIETDPPGAKVYFNAKEDGEVCTTPCTIDAPIGETPVIIEAEDRRSIIENLVVPRKARRPIKLRFKLEPAVGTLIIAGADGATIKIDDEDRGTAPTQLDDIQAGAHHVVLERDGKRLYDGFVEVEIGGEAIVSPSAADAPPAGPEDEAAIAAPAFAPRAEAHGRWRTPSFVVSGAVDVAFRQFSYHNNRTPQTQRDEKQVGQVLAGPIIELWPTRLLKLDMLHGLAIYGRFELGLNKQAVAERNPQTGMSTNTSLTTAWSSLEISVHQRWMIANAGTIEVGAGYTDDRYQFKGRAEEIEIVPDAAYKAVRIGGRASLLFGSLEPYVAIENRAVLSGGAMDERYTVGTSVNGVRGALGAAARLDSFELRLEGSLTLYTWTFRPDSTDATQADGGSDFIQNVTLAVGYIY
jgi:hypothetical protein